MAARTDRVRRPATASAGVGVRPGSTGAAPSAYAREVLDIVDRIPPGKVMTYGDVAEMHGRGSARTVGAVMSEHGREVPWHRVVQASGRPAEPYVAEAVRLLAAEGCPVAAERVVMSAARWDGRHPGPRDAGRPRRPSVPGDCGGGGTDDRGNAVGTLGTAPVPGTRPSEGVLAVRCARPAAVCRRGVLDSRA